jgi:hypothetical protein
MDVEKSRSLLDKRKRYVIRVRAETDQFLLACTKLETFVQWLQSLFAAIDLAPPLDDRQIPRDLSIPRSSRNRCGRTPSSMSNPTLIQQQVQLIRERYPHLVDEAAMDGIIQSPASRPSSPRPVAQPPNTQQMQTDPVVRVRRREDTRPLFDSDGKWCPPRNWSAMHDMIYAKRCMAVLTHRSPRKTDYVIAKGRRWIVDWRTGKLRAADSEPPPEYAEIRRDSVC